MNTGSPQAAAARVRGAGGGLWTTPCGIDQKRCAVDLWTMAAQKARAATGPRAWITMRPLSTPAPLRPQLHSAFSSS